VIVDLHSLGGLGLFAVGLSQDPVLEPGLGLSERLGGLFVDLAGPLGELGERDFLLVLVFFVFVVCGQSHLRENQGEPQQGYGTEHASQHTGTPFV